MLCAAMLFVLFSVFFLAYSNISPARARQRSSVRDCGGPCRDERHRRNQAFRAQRNFAELARGFSFFSASSAMIGSRPSAEYTPDRN